MNITLIMSTTILFFVLYASFRSWILNRRIKKANMGWKKLIERIAAFSFGDKIRFCAAIILIGFVAYFVLTQTGILFTIFSVPGLIIYVLVIFSSIGTVWSIVKSKDATQLNEQERESLVVLGSLLSIIGVIRAAGFDKQYSAQESSLIQCIALVVEYAVYLFFVGTLGDALLKDCASGMLRFAERYAKEFRMLENNSRNKAIPHKIENLCSEKPYSVIMKEKGWKRIAYIVCVVLAVPVDVLRYLVHYSVCIIFWLPVFCLFESFAMICRLFLKLARSIYALSDRRVAVIAFRSAIAAAMLIVVVMNRYRYITTSDETTAVLEFIASVVIIPIVFGWVQDVWPINSDTGNVNPGES